MNFENKVGQFYRMFDDSVFSTDTKDTAEKAYSCNKFTTEVVDSWLAELQSGVGYHSAGTGMGQEKQSKRKGRKNMTIHKLRSSKEPHLLSDLLQQLEKIWHLIDPCHLWSFVGTKQNSSNFLMTPKPNTIICWRDARK